MNKQKRIIMGVILVAVMLMAIGYALIQNINLTIDGTASATAVQDNFKVYFTGNATKSSETNVATTITEGAIKATVNISGLSKQDDTEYAILEIENGSNEVNASSVNVTASGADTDIFDIEVVMCDETGGTITDYKVNSGNKTYVKVSATLLKTPTSDVSTSISATIKAVPEEVK